MIADDRAYYQRRAAQCRQLAEQSNDTSVRMAHRAMERRYRSLIGGVTPELTNG
ncbi:hypothetical protein ACNI3Q_04250 [Sphingomonas sp. FW199]